eukprot:9379360-Heterocapsa_arctica.AAC.1
MSSPQRRIATNTASASRVACEAESPLTTRRCRASSAETSDANQARMRSDGTWRRKAPTPHGDASATTMSSEWGAPTE